MENPQHSFREMNLVPQLIQELGIKELQIKSKTDKLELVKEKKSALFGTFILYEGDFF